MLSQILTALFILSYTSIEINGEPRVAAARLASENITGTILFAETDAGIYVSGIITGLDAGKYGFHVHELGDITSCDTAGPHFEPGDASHGGRDHDVRHVGDFGNVEFNGTDIPIANVSFVDNIISLRGRNSILGRTLVLHKNKDDLGLGDNELSLITGNAGPRIACGVIGIKSPGAPWNSAKSVLPSFILLLCALCLFVY